MLPYDISENPELEHTALFSLKGMQQRFWRVQVTNLQCLYEKVTAGATVGSCWTHTTFPRHSVKANTRGCCGRSTSCQSTQEVPVPENSVHYRLDQITRELGAQHEVQARSKQSRQDWCPHAENGNGTPPSSVLRKDEEWEICTGAERQNWQQQETTGLIQMLEEIQEKSATETCNNSQNTHQYVLSVWSKALQSLLFLIWRKNWETLQAGKIENFPSYK